MRDQNYDIFFVLKKNQKNNNTDYSREVIIYLPPPTNSGPIFKNISIV